MSGGSTKKPKDPMDTVGSTVVARTVRGDARAYADLRKRRLSEKKRKNGFEAVRPKADALFVDLDENVEKRGAVPPPHVVASRILLAASIDATPGLAAALANREPVVVLIDVADPAVLASLRTWGGDILVPGGKCVSAGCLVQDTSPDAYGVVDMFVFETPKPSKRAEKVLEAALALQMGLPIVAFSPDARSHLPEILTATADHRLVVGALDPALVDSVIATVTGRRCLAAIDETVCNRLGVVDLSAAIRSGLAPSECVARLKRIAASRVREREARDLRLADIHGMDDAVAWARAAIADVAAWKAGDIGWSSVERACLLAGPPGTFKSSLAKVLSRELSMNLVVGSFAKWQSAGHMGDFLAAMKKDFAEIRRTGGVMMIDELDSFVVRGVSSNRREDSYLSACVNGLLEETDGLVTNEGVILVAGTNHPDRIDPALLRAGRFNRVVHVGLPDGVALARMLRVRLGSELPDLDLRPLAAQALGMTGADVERAVEDARRLARRDGCELAAVHVSRSLGDDDIPAGLRWRIAVHEAGHLAAEVALQGPDGVTAVVTRRMTAPGRVVRRGLRRDDVGTYAWFFDRIRIDLAGRAAEEVLLGSVSDGAGGTSPGSDLSNASAAAMHVVSGSGLDGPRPLLVLPDRGGLLAERDVIKAADDLLSRAAASIRLLLLANRPALEEIALRLQRDGSLDGAAAERILFGEEGPIASAEPKLRSPEGRDDPPTAAAGEGE